MKVKWIILAICCVMLISSCVRHFDAVREGMSTCEMKELIGSPDSIRNDFFAEVWFYENHVITISCDTVSMIRTKKELREEARKMQEELMKIKKRL